MFVVYAFVVIVSIISDGVISIVVVAVVVVVVVVVIVAVTGVIVAAIVGARNNTYLYLQITTANCARITIPNQVATNGVIQVVEKVSDTYKRRYMLGSDKSGLVLATRLTNRTLSLPM